MKNFAPLFASSEWPTKFAFLAASLLAASTSTLATASVVPLEQDWLPSASVPTQPLAAIKSARQPLSPVHHHNHAENLSGAETQEKLTLIHTRRASKASEATDRFLRQPLNDFPGSKPSSG